MHSIALTLQRFYTFGIIISSLTMRLGIENIINMLFIFYKPNLLKNQAAMTLSNQFLKCLFATLY